MNSKKEYVLCVEVKEYETGEVVSIEHCIFRTSLDELIMAHFMHKRVEELAKELEVPEGVVVLLELLRVLLPMTLST